MNNNNNKNNFLLFFIIFLTSFLLWILFSFNIGNNTNFELLKTNKNDSISIKWELDLTKFWEVYNLIKINNYNSEWINKEELVDFAIKWMVDSLWDKHSEFFNVEETKKFNDVLSWDFEWIWAVVDENILWVIIERIIKWSPAKKYWLQSWDIIISANWEKLEWLDLYDAVDKIKWPAWTNVVLEIIRSWEKNILTIDVIREKIKIPSVDYKIIDDTNLAYIAINMFWEETASEFKKALDDNINTDWIIIDLRDNWGGYLQSAVSILSDFIEEDKTLVTTKYKDIFSTISYPSMNDWKIYNWKIVILINENSASASEITAWALKDYNKAIIVWKKSYWKWSVQKPFELKDGSMLKLTIAKWFTPNDKNIDWEGIMPDIEVDFKKEDYTPEEWKEDEFVPYDRQFEVAKEVLKLFIENDAYKLSIDNFLENNEEYKPNLEK
jgi:carboxyl-terminal processing protease